MANPIYQRRPKESEEAYAAFLVYRNMGQGRTIAAVGQALGKSEALMERWSFRHGWVERARAWDVQLQAERDGVRPATQSGGMIDETPFHLVLPLSEGGES